MCSESDFSKKYQFYKSVFSKQLVYGESDFSKKYQCEQCVYSKSEFSKKNQLGKSEISKTSDLRYGLAQNGLPSPPSTSMSKKF